MTMIFKSQKPEDINLLIEGCRKNNNKAQLKVYNRYYKGMYAISLNMIGNTVEAEDAMQEAFIAAFKNIDTYKGEVTFGAWLKKIVINKCIDYLKKKKIQFDNIENHQDISDNKSDEIEETDLTLEAEIIREEILNLPEGYRAVLTLFLLEGYDHEEIAQVLNISASTSRSQFVRAKMLLIKRLKNNSKD